MNKLPPFLQVLIAGGVAALLTSLLLWVLTITGLFVLLRIPVAAPADPTQWFGWRTVSGCVYALLLFIPLLTESRQALRALIVSVVPMLKLFLWDYPQGREGWFGLNLGVTLPLTVIVTWLLWGLVAGLILERWNFGGEVADEQPIPPE